MHAKLILLVAVLVLGWLALNWFMRTPPEKVARILRRTALYGGVGLLVLLALTGRLHWLFAALAAAVPLVQRGLTLMRVLPMLRRVAAMAGVSIPGVAGAGGPGGQGQSSTVNTAYLRMTLDHATGEMDGTVLQGRHQGRSLSELETAELVALLGEYRAADAQSASVLEAYLDRAREEDWRERFDAGPGADGAEAAPSGGSLSEAEALEILGLEAGATRDDVRAAHRQLMQRFHPDRGGSGYLATLINRAKELLLERLPE
jgi:hypothetical protein